MFRSMSKLVALSLVAIAGLAQAGENEPAVIAAWKVQDQVPNHLISARELVVGTLPENNFYAATGTEIVSPGDRTRTGKVADRYVVRTNTEGLVTYVLAKTNSGVLRAMAQNGYGASKVADFRRSIANNVGFSPVGDVQSLRPGDVIAWKTDKGEDSLLLIDSLPTKMSADHYEVSFIEVSKQLRGTEDTRYIRARELASASGMVDDYSQAQGSQGIGAGVISLRVDAASGKVLTVGDSSRGGVEMGRPQADYASLAKSPT